MTRFYHPLTRLLSVCITANLPTSCQAISAALFLLLFAFHIISQIVDEYPNLLNLNYRFSRLLVDDVGENVGKHFSYCF
jgi:hypothetical protein